MRNRDLGINWTHVAMVLYALGCIGYCTWTLYVWAFTGLVDFLMKWAIP